MSQNPSLHTERYFCKNH